MISSGPISSAPPITEVPEYVWCRRYDKPAFLPGRPVQRPKEEGRRISHPDAESALRAAKQACRGHRNRWFGRGSDTKEKAAFLVYEAGKIIERHVVKKR